MAIKAIINNTEKEIEQIKDSDEQDIDYVYSRIGDTEVEGEPPISIKSIGGELANYRIYGNTVSGESVGDLIESGEHAGEYKVPVTVEGKNLFDENAEVTNKYVNSNGEETDSSNGDMFNVNKIAVKPDTTYTFSWQRIVLGTNNYPPYIRVSSYDSNNNFLVRDLIQTNNYPNKVCSITTPNSTAFLDIRVDDISSERGQGLEGLMLNVGSTPLPYEPYHAPITTPIYLPEPIKMVGDEAEYIDYADQKLHRIGADDIDVTLPALSTIKGTNTISVNTSIQPSNMYIKDNFNYKKVFTATRTIEGESPLNYKNIEDNDSTLSNYRIYGNTVGGAGVGDLVESGEHEGEYKVPVTVSNGTDTLTTPIYLPEQIKKVGDEAEYIDYGEQKQHRVRKNLLQNTATSQTINGVAFTVNNDGSVTCNGTASAITYFNLNENFNSTLYAGMKASFYQSEQQPNVNIFMIRISKANRVSIQDFTMNDQVIKDNGDSLLLAIRINSGYTCNNLTFYPMIRKAGIVDDTYEPYIENTDLDVTLPALPTLTGTNTLTVGTEAQPSDIYLKGKIKKKPKIYYKIYYYSQDGQTALSTETVEEGHDCTYSTVPTKESDTDFDYTFTGWSTSTNSTTATAGATENIQQNTNLYAAFSKSLKGDTISDSWEEIIANCDNGTYASKYQIGDLKTIDVGTEGPVQMQIVAIDTDLLASDNTQTAPITWISKQLLNTYKAMHSTSSNYLSDWANCNMRTYLKNTILPMLPSVVQNNIKEVTKYTNQRTGSTTFTTISSTEDIWLPSYREVVTDYYNSTSCETSGVQYNSIFTNDDASQRIKSQVGDDDASFWWTRSASAQPLSNYSYYFAYVGNNGYVNYTGWVCSSFGGVAIGFCT